MPPEAVAAVPIAWFARPAACRVCRAAVRRYIPVGRFNRHGLAGTTHRHGSINAAHPHCPGMLPGQAVWTLPPSRVGVNMLPGRQPGIRRTATLRSISQGSQTHRGGFVPPRTPSAQPPCPGRVRWMLADASTARAIGHPSGTAHPVTRTMAAAPDDVPPYPRRPHQKICIPDPPGGTWQPD